MTSLKKISTSILASGLALGLTSCQPFQNEAGDMSVTFPVSDAIILDVVATTCVSSKETEVRGDLSAMHFNLGKPTINWVAPDAASRLQIVYIRVTFAGNGLANTEKPIVLGSEELNCVVSGNTKLSPELSASNGPSYAFSDDVKVGGLKSLDPSNRQSFNGTANILVYAVLIQNDVQVAPVIGRTSVRYSFQGIY